MRILICEDDKDLRNAYVSILSQPNVEIRPVPDGEVGLTLAANLPFDLIITDHDMPKMKGLDMVREIRKFSKIPIIVCSGNDWIAEEVGKYENCSFLPKLHATKISGIVQDYLVKNL